MSTIRDYDFISKRAKDSFASVSIPKILERYPDLDAEKLSKTAQDFFNIFCDLNQVYCYNNYPRFSDRPEDKAKDELRQDTSAQWQYYAAFFYRKLTSDSDLHCVYTPKELDYLELRMSCPAQETMNLQYYLAEKVLGSIIREAIDNISNEHHFNKTPIFTIGSIPRNNNNDSEVLTTVTAPQSSHAQSAATSPSTPAHAPSQLAQGVSA